MFQIGVCKRMLKEVDAYQKEVIVNEARVQKMREEGKDEYGKHFTFYSYFWIRIYTFTL